MPNEITPGMVGYAKGMTEAAVQRHAELEAAAEMANDDAEAHGWDLDHDLAADEARHAADLASYDLDLTASDAWYMEHAPDQVGARPAADLASYDLDLTASDAWYMEHAPDQLGARPADPEPAALDQDVDEPDREPEPG